MEEVESLLPNYKFESFIAKGGMGAVYKATQISLDRPVAIKILPIEFGQDDQFRESFETEAKLMARLNHPNLISIYDFGEIDGMLYIVMELVPGKSLYEKAYQKALKQELAIDLIKQICEGLEHAHEAGILHRDIKPANILLKKKIPKIGDFGLARAVGNSESGGVIYGTPGYTAPEVINHPDMVDQRADIYSVGIMLYELLTGGRPEGAYQPVNTHVDCDSRLDKIVRKAINPNPRLRYASAKEMANELGDLLRELENSGANGPLRVGGGKAASRVNLAVPGTPSRASGAQLKTSSQSVSPAAKLATSAAPSAVPTSTTTHKVGTGGDSSAIRNIVIIVILLVAIYIAQDMLVKRKQEVKDIEARNAQENERIMKENEAAKAAHMTQYQNNGASKAPSGNPAKPEPVKKSKLEALASLKEDLASGQRPLQDMPEEVFYLSSESRMLLFVETPMSWMEADEWCREHGAYLATVRNSSDLAVIADKIPANTRAWMGAGKSGKSFWAWSDGSPFSDELQLRKTSKLLFVNLGTDTMFELVPEQEKLPFVMEWRTDGSNPGGLVERMQATKQSLNQIDPMYPPGTQTLGSRNFCLVRADVDSRQAREMARAAGGELFVPSDEVELAAVNAMLKEALPGGEKAWIGGKKVGENWEWYTGENWGFANWEQDHPANGDGLAVMGNANSSWVDVSRQETLPYFLVEWSKDKAEYKPDELKEGGDSGAASFASLRKKAEELLEKENTSREEKHLENMKRLEWDINAYFKGLSSGDQAMQAEPLNEIKKMYAGKRRLPDEIDGSGPSQKVQGFTRYSYEKQQRIEREFLTNVDKIRMAYIGQLNKVKEGLVKKGQITAARKVENEIEEASRSNKSFLAIFDIE